ncbi:MAG: hypothetical protein ACKVT2_12015 [Saprospiraceae bacterium]
MNNLISSPFYARTFKVRALLLGLLFGFGALYLNGQCTMVCNDQIEVAVPLNGSTEVLPAFMLEGDYNIYCPNGIFQSQIQSGNIWLPAAGNFVALPAHIGQTFVMRIRDSNSGNACWGNIHVVEAPQLLDTVQFQLCAELWKGARPIKGATLSLQPGNPAFPYPPLVFNLDSSQSCVQVTVVMNDYLPGTTFSYSASLPDSNHLNGVDIVDLCKISEHILGINPLPSPYAMFAADANKSGSITTYDLVEYRKLILGTYKELPNNESWRFISDYCEFPNPNNPFQTGCSSGISSADLIALDGDTAKVIGIKVGDVNGNVRLIGEPILPPVPNDSINLLLPLGQLTAGVPVAIPVKFDKNFNLGSLQAHFFLNPGLVQFDSISDGLMNVASTNAYYTVTNGRLIFVSGGFQGVFVSVGSPLFYIHIKPLVSTDLNVAVKVILDDPYVKTFATSDNCDIYYTMGSMYSGSVATYSPELSGLRVRPPSPNPFGDQSFLEIDSDDSETAFLEVVDLAGRMVFSEEKNLSPGLNRWEIPGSALASGSLGIWRLRVGDQMIAGKLLRR